MLKKKKATASGKLVLVKSVRRTRSHRMIFCVQRGLGALPSTSKRIGGVTDRCFVVGRRAKERGIEVNGIFREVEVVDRDAKATGFLLAIADSDVEKASVRVGDFEGVRIFS